jgi:cyclopropane-fatty-acyl-phospholipid synthase
MQAENILKKQIIKERRSHSSFIIRTIRKTLFNKVSSLGDIGLLIQDNEGSYRFGKSIDVKLTIHDHNFYKRLMYSGTMGLSEAYMCGEWTCNNLYELFRMFAKNRNVINNIDGTHTLIARPFLLLKEKLIENTIFNTRSNISAHYDLGNDLFKLFLDPTLTYSSAYFKEPHMTLEQASTAKIDRLCSILELKKGDHLLEIGTGWGSTAIHAAQKYGCKVTTTTLSIEQKKLAEERILELGLQNQIKVVLEDYRKLVGRFDKIISIEMIEAIGSKYYGAYFKKCNQLLKKNGLLAIQAITIPDHAYKDHLKNVDFIQKYIFPGSKIPCIQILNRKASERGCFELCDLFDLSQDYAKTMNIWFQSFIEKIDQVKALGYDDRFIRMWSYYLNYCAAGFKERYLGTSQILFRKNE